MNKEQIITWIKKQINIAKTDHIDKAWNGTHQWYNADYAEAMKFLDELNGEKKSDYTPIYDKRVAVIKSMPPVYCDIGKPKFDGYFWVDLNEWSIEKNDYVKSPVRAYFDGSQFYLEDIGRFDNSVWISDWCYVAVLPVCYKEEKFVGSAEWQKDVDRGWRSYADYKGVEDPIEFKNKYDYKG